VRAPSRARSNGARDLRERPTEHIWWDQAGALRQAGLLPERVPLPGADGGTLRLPVAGAEAARLAVDEMAGGGNAMLSETWANGDI
jgi:carboxymethylenebutenolidase